MNIKFTKLQSIVERDQTSKIKVMVAARSSGKSYLMLRSAIISCLTYEGPISPLDRPLVVICMESQTVAKSIHWLYLLSFIEEELKNIVLEYNKTELRVRFVGCRPDLLITGMGTDGLGNHLRGKSFYKFYLDETQNIPNVEYLLDYVILPRLLDNGQVLCIGTASSGLLSPFHRLTMRDGVKHYKFTVYDNELFTEEKINYLKTILSDKAFKAEFMSEFIDSPANVFDSFTEDNLGSYRSANNALRVLKEVYYLGTDSGTVNAAYVVIKCLILEDNSIVLEAVDSWQSDSIVTVDEILDKWQTLNNNYKFYRILIPDDRSDLVISARRRGLKQAISIPRNAIGYKPSHRFDKVNNMFYNQTLYINGQLILLIDQIKGYKRQLLDDGSVVADKFVKGNDHLLDALSGGVAYITNKVFEGNKNDYS
jgi:hypothetical protein